MGKYNQYILRKKIYIHNFRGVFCGIRTSFILGVDERRRQDFRALEGRVTQVRLAPDKYYNYYKIDKLLNIT